MWYHYIGLLVGAYVLATSLYSLIMKPRTVLSIAFSAGYIVAGLMLLMWGYNGISAPPPSILGGRRR